MADPLRSTDPRSIGRYRTLSRLGEGGMGSVFLAQGPDERLVAVKVIRPEFAHEPEYRARFRSEVSRARQVPPFCTAEVLDADPDHATPYLVVEYVDGPSLNDVVSDGGPLGGGSLHGVAVGVAAALAAIHGAGVIHRDLKPRNVLFALGTPKVIDFGIARPLEPTSFHTRAEEMVGTLAYMAPERFDTLGDQVITTAVDVFAWGAVVTYAGTGRTPFGGDSPTVTAARILTQPPRLGDLPPYLAELVLAALEKEPANRPAATELLDRLLVSGAPSAPPLPAALRREAEAAQLSGRHQTVPPPARRGRRAGTLAAVAAAAVAVAVTGGVLLARNATPVPAGIAPAEAPAVTGPSLFDALQRPGYFDTAKAAEGSCGYRDGLRVTAAAGKTMTCGPTPPAVFPAGQSVSVRATLANAGSCASIWFRVAGDGPADDPGQDRLSDHYEAAVCPGEVRLASSIGGAETVIATARRATATGTAHRIALVADDRSATVTVDGDPALDGPLTESTLISGRVLLGASARPGGRASVTFADAQLRSGTTPDFPAVPAFTTGDAVFTAGVWMLYDAGKVAILEPTGYLTGADYCRRYVLASTSPQCARKFVATASSTRVSLPVAARPQYLDYRRAPAKCTDPATHAGTCRVTFDEFATTTDETTPWAALVTVRGGTVVTVAMLNLR